MSDIPLFPVATVSVGPVMQHELVTIRFDYLTNPCQRPEEANPGRHYALTPQQAHGLVEQILSALQKLESAAPAPEPGPTH